MQLEVKKTVQSAPVSLLNGMLRIMNTTDKMQYSTDEQTWKDCTDGSTNVAAGTYYVRYKETDILTASASVTVTVTDNEQSIQEEPKNLTDSYEKIGNTTSAMEYSTDKITWKDCTDGSTAAVPGTYFVRYKATKTKKASTAVLIFHKEYFQRNTEYPRLSDCCKWQDREYNICNGIQS